MSICIDCNKTFGFERELERCTRCLAAAKLFVFGTEAERKTLTDSKYFAARSARVTVTCKECKEILRVTPSKAERFVYCSPVCSQVSQAREMAAKRISRPCECCGALMTVITSQRATQRFCGQACRNKSLQNARVTVTCKLQGCSNEFTSPGGTVARKKYCSHDCQRNDINRLKRCGERKKCEAQSHTGGQCRSYAGASGYCSSHDPDRPRCGYKTHKGKPCNQWPAGKVGLCLEHGREANQ